MRLLATSDLHGNKSQYEKLPSLVKEHSVDILILAGDLTNRSGKSERDFIFAILEKINIPILFLMGNDDREDWAKIKGHSLISVNQKKIKIGEYSFVGYQYTTPFVGGIFEKLEEEMSVELKELKKLMDEDTIIITHGPAYNILDKTSYDMNVGSKSLKYFLEQVPFRLHIHGHIHESFGVENKHFNVAAPKFNKAVIIDLPELEYFFVDYGG